MTEWAPQSQRQGSFRITATITKPSKALRWEKSRCAPKNPL